MAVPCSIVDSFPFCAAILAPCQTAAYRVTSGLSCHGGIKEVHVVAVMTGTEDGEETREDEAEEKATEGNGKSSLGGVDLGN